MRREDAGDVGDLIVCTVRPDSLSLPGGETVSCLSCFLLCRRFVSSWYNLMRMDLRVRGISSDEEEFCRCGRLSRGLSSSTVLSLTSVSDSEVIASAALSLLTFRFALFGVALRTLSPTSLVVKEPGTSLGWLVGPRQFRLKITRLSFLIGKYGEYRPFSSYNLVEIGNPGATNADSTHRSDAASASTNLLVARRILPYLDKGRWAGFCLGKSGDVSIASSADISLFTLPSLISSALTLSFPAFHLGVVSLLTCWLALRFGMASAVALSRFPSLYDRERLCFGLSDSLVPITRADKIFKEFMVQQEPSVFLLCLISVRRDNNAEDSQTSSTGLPKFLEASGTGCSVNQVIV